MSALQGISTRLNRAYAFYVDNQLSQLIPSERTATIAVMGVAERGRTTTPARFNNTNIGQANRLFGVQGDLTEQIREAEGKGEQALLALRIGARPCFLQHIGGTTGGLPLDGLWVQPVEGGEEWGTRYGIAYATSDTRLVLKDLENDLVLFDNNPLASVDRGLFLIRGTAVVGSGSNIGTASDFNCVPLNTADSYDAQIHFYDGDDGTRGLSRNELFVAMMNGFKVYQDVPDWRTMVLSERMTINAPTGTYVSGTIGTQPPTLALLPDVLSPVYLEEVNGVIEGYFDLNGNGTAEFWTVNDTGTYSTRTLAGKALAASDFKTPNFVYAAAYEMLRLGVEGRFVNCVAGVELPQPGRPMSEWYGSTPVFSTDLEGNVTVSSNGTGLLGHRYLMGATNYRSASAFGGMIATTEPYFETGAELEDEEGNPVDIGKYVTLWATPEFFQGIQGVRSNLPYMKISAAAYAAFNAQLNLSQSVVNRPYPAAGVTTNRIPLSVQEAFMDARITLARNSDRGVRILDGATLALPTSDYTRQSSMRLIEIVDSALREVANRYIGRMDLTPLVEKAFEQEMNQEMDRLRDLNVIQGGYVTLQVTPLQRTRGEADAFVVIQLPYELRKVTFTMRLTAGA